MLLLDTPKPGAVAVAEQVRTRVAEERFTSGESQPGGRLTISIGVACCPDDADSPGGLVVAADQALYQAKRGGRNRVEAAPDNTRQE